jgi:Uma2 family endonuclease
VVVTKTRITVDEYLAMEELEGRRTNLIDGEVVVSEPTPWHQLAATAILFALGLWEKEGAGRGFVCLPLDIRLDEFNVYAPDVLWYEKERAPAITDPRPYAPPDLVVEIRSPSTWRHDIGRKKSGYEAAGVRELWLVDFTSVLVFRRSEPKRPDFDVTLELAPEETLTSPLLPGFALPLAGLYPGGQAPRTSV